MVFHSYIAGFKNAKVSCKLCDGICRKHRQKKVRGRIRNFFLNSDYATPYLRGCVTLDFIL